MKDYYQILGVNHNASLEEIKIAYRKLAMKFHPDKNNGDKYFENRFRDIYEAYEHLSNENLRKQFDDNLYKFYNRINEKDSHTTNRDYTNNSSKKTYSKQNESIKIKKNQLKVM